MARRARLYIIAALVFIMLFIILASGGTQYASAAASSFSDVLDDLRKDASFDYEDFPPNTEDYGLYVKQIAESEQGELLIYVYQPACRKDLLATSINIAREPDDSENLSFDNYSLEYLNSTGTFFKYRVKGFELRADAERYYNVASIFRKWVKGIDEEPEDGSYNYVEEVAFPVAQFWTVYQDGADVHYDMTTSEVIEVTDKYLGHVHFTKDIIPSWSTFGFYSADDGWDCWFLAFDTDKPIEKLLEADLVYDLWGWEIVMGVPVPAAYSHNRKATVKHTDKQKVEAVGAFQQRYNYKFDRIQSVDEFKGNVTDPDARESLVGKKWVLCFAETTTGGYNIGNSLIGEVPFVYVKYTVNKVSVLRLEFETEGQHYNLGVVDNKQSASVWQPPANKEEELGFWEYVWQCIVKLFTGKANFFEGFVAVVALVVAVMLLGGLLFVLSLLIPPIRRLLFSGRK